MKKTFLQEPKLLEECLHLYINMLNLIMRYTAQSADTEAKPMILRVPLTETLPQGTHIVSPA